MYTVNAVNAMNSATKSTNPAREVKSDTADGNARLTLYIAGARSHLNQGATVPRCSPWNQDSIALLTSSQF